MSLLQNYRETFPSTAWTRARRSPRTRVERPAWTRMSALAGTVLTYRRPRSDARGRSARQRPQPSSRLVESRGVDRSSLGRAGGAVSDPFRIGAHGHDAEASIPRCHARRVGAGLDRARAETSAVSRECRPRSERLRRACHVRDPGVVPTALASCGGIRASCACELLVCAEEERRYCGRLGSAAASAAQAGISRAHVRSAMRAVVNGSGNRNGDRNDDNDDDGRRQVLFTPGRSSPRRREWPRPLRSPMRGSREIRRRRPDRSAFPSAQRVCAPRRARGDR
jgi:hypothetical protein